MDASVLEDSRSQLIHLGLVAVSTHGHDAASQVAGCDYAIGYFRRGNGLTVRSGDAGRPSVAMGR